MPEQLFLVSIGPVQEFIAAARRSRDLWFGSWMLSELAKAAARTISAEPWNGLLIFPAPDPSILSDQSRSVPNRVLAEINATIQPAELGKAVVVGVQAALAGLSEPVFNGIDWPEEPPYLEDLARAQVADLLSGLIFWASTPLEPDYPTARRRLEDLMAGRKLTRDFGPSPIAGVVAPTTPGKGLRLPKSTLDGTRESVIAERLFGERGDSDARRRDKAKYLYERYGARPAERMSGVDLLKRRGKPQAADADIPSTSHFAALPLLERTAGTGSSEVFERQLAQLRRYGARPELLAERYRNVSHIGGYDAGILFPERLAEEVDRVDLVEARGVLSQLLTATTDGKAPEPYYALLAADGDFMGDTINCFARAAGHRQFSQALSGFASGVRAIVEESHQGALIYAGGDDVLAFLPLHTVLACAEELAETFRREIGEAIDRLSGEDFVGELKSDRPKPTLSVGVAIAHHIEPLGDTLQLARDAEAFAKQLPGKNALAITLSKRSGVDRRVRGRWSNAEGAFLKRLRDFVLLHREEAIPDGAAYELRDLAERLRDAPSELRVELDTAMRVNAIGIFKRKRGRRGEEEVAPEVIVGLRVALGLVSGSTEPIDVATLADELIVAREFARVLGLKEGTDAAVDH